MTVHDVRRSTRYCGTGDIVVVVRPVHRSSQMVALTSIDVLGASARSVCRHLTHSVTTPTADSVDPRVFTYPQPSPVYTRTRTSRVRVLMGTGTGQNFLPRGYPGHSLATRICDTHASPEFSSFVVTTDEPPRPQQQQPQNTPLEEWQCRRRYTFFWFERR